MMCPKCREFLTGDDFRRIGKSGKRHAAMCRACELREKLDRELADRRRRQAELLEWAGKVRRAVTPDD